jgi:hypothetical protein
VMLSLAQLTARKKRKWAKLLWHECIDWDSFQMLWEAPNLYLSLLLRRGPRGFYSLETQRDKAQGSYVHLMTLSSVTLGQNWTARWPKCSDEVPVPRGQRREVKSIQTEKKKGQESLLCLPLIWNVHKQSKIKHPLKKDKRWSTVC